MTVSQAERAAPVRTTSARHSVEPVLIEPFTTTTTSMGGRLAVHLDAVGRTPEAEADERRVIARIDGPANDAVGADCLRRDGQRVGNPLQQQFFRFIPAEGNVPDQKWHACIMSDKVTT